ncbi:MAG: ribose-phosphate diphosphokinase, partial [Bdellovibrionales bacterium]
MTLLFALPGNEPLAERLWAGGCRRGELDYHTFPDGEVLPRFLSDVSQQHIYLLCSLDRPNEKMAGLMFLAETARALGAHSVHLVAPYLGYMRQDKSFHQGEAVTSHIFAKFLSHYFDTIITVDPHLHRHKSLETVFNDRIRILHCAGIIGSWIERHIEKPCLIGPDEESSQWVERIAMDCDIPYQVLSKVRQGDQDVSVSLPDVRKLQGHTPVIVDDIISTGRTIMAAAELIRGQEFKMALPVCIGIHAVFAADAWQTMRKTGLER